MEIDGGTGGPVTDDQDLDQGTGVELLNSVFPFLRCVSSTDVASVVKFNAAYFQHQAPETRPKAIRSFLSVHSLTIKYFAEVISAHE